MSITGRDVPTGMTFLLIHATGGFFMLYVLEEIKWYILYEALIPGILGGFRFF